MTIDHLMGLPVISAADGERLGTVGWAYLDPKAMRIAGIAFHTGGGLLDLQLAPKVDAANIASLGSDAVVLPDKSSVRGDEIDRRYAELIDVGTLTDRQVLTDDGRILGKLASIAFDGTSFAVTELGVAHGLLKNQLTVAADAVMAVGPDFIIVASPATAAPESRLEATAGSYRIVEEPRPAPDAPAG